MRSGQPSAKRPCRGSVASHGGWGGLNASQVNRRPSGLAGRLSVIPPISRKTLMPHGPILIQLNILWPAQ